jgi:hypothetical protein
MWQLEADVEEAFSHRSDVILTLRAVTSSASSCHRLEGRKRRRRRRRRRRWRQVDDVAWLLPHLLALITWSSQLKTDSLITLRLRR